MRIDSTEFGAVAIDAKTCKHDVIIHLSGKVEKRRFWSRLFRFSA